MFIGTSDLHVILITDLSTRRGLRKALTEIDRIYAELEAFRQLAKRRNSSQLLAAVVSILIKMCTDSIIKEKLFERGASDVNGSVLRCLTPLYIRHRSH